MDELRILRRRQQGDRFAGFAGQADAGEVDSELRQMIVRGAGKQQAHHGVPGKTWWLRIATHAAGTTAGDGSSGDDGNSNYKNARETRHVFLTDRSRWPAERHELLGDIARSRWLP